MAYPIAASININLRVPRDGSPKEPVSLKHHSAGFKLKRFESITAFTEAISATEDTHGAGFCFGAFDNDYRNGANFRLSYGQGMDFDKIVLGTGENEEILWDECLKRLPTREQLLASRIGPFIRMMYRSSSCPDDSPYFMGRAVLSYERPLTQKEQKAFGIYIATLLCEDFPLIDPEVLRLEGMRGGIDTRAIKNSVCWWAGIKYGRTPCFIDENVPPVPTALIDSWVGEGNQYLSDYTNSKLVGGEAINLDKPTTEVFDTLIRHIMPAPTKGTYSDIFLPVATFVKKVGRDLYPAFADWCSKSDYRMETAVKNNPTRYLESSRLLDFATIGTVIKILDKYCSDWREQYYQLTGKRTWFSHSYDLVESDRGEYKMTANIGEAEEALVALGLK